MNWMVLPRGYSSINLDQCTFKMSLWTWKWFVGMDFPWRDRNQKVKFHLFRTWKKKWVNHNNYHLWMIYSIVMSCNDQNQLYLVEFRFWASMCVSTISFSNNKIQSSFCPQSRSWRKCIQMNIELTEVRRQTDKAFISLLQAVRVGRYWAFTTSTVQSSDSLARGVIGM